MSSVVHVALSPIVWLAVIGFGVLLLLLGKGDAMATVLITAGVGGLTGGSVVAKRQAAASDKRAQEALEQTQTIIRERLTPPPTKDGP